MDGKEEKRSGRRKGREGAGRDGRGRGGANVVHVKCEACGAGRPKGRPDKVQPPISDLNSISAPRPYARCLNVQLDRCARSVLVINSETYVA